jgi:putative ABC transport system ATP-binding protein
MLICSNLMSLRVDISFPTIEVTEGQRILISGASGSGKSTLLNLIAGLDTDYNGQVQFLEQDWNALKAAQRQQLRADHIGIIFQSLNLIPYLSLIDNVELPARFSVIRRNAADRSAAELLDCLGLPSAMHRRKPDQLSLGQRQRVAAARALYGAPKLILADEPTSALDSHNAQRFIDLLTESMNPDNQSLVMVTHDLSLANGFDRHMHLDAGHA